MAKMQVRLNGGVYTSTVSTETSAKEAANAWADICNKVDYLTLQTSEEVVVFNEQNCKDMIVVFLEEI